MAATGSTPASKPASRKAAIEACALRLFVERGFAATSVREITSEVGVTVPTLYYYFDSKDGLLAALVQGLVDAGEAALAELASLPPGPTARDTALETYYDVVTRHLDVFRLVMADPSVRSHPVAGHHLAGQGARFLAQLAGDTAERADLVRANAALGAIRRPLRLADIDPVADRAQVLASARAALAARP